MGHTAWAPEGRDGRYQAGLKGPKDRKPFLETSEKIQWNFDIQNICGIKLQHIFGINIQNIFGINIQFFCKSNRTFFGIIIQIIFGINIQYIFGINIQNIFGNQIEHIFGIIIQNIFGIYIQYIHKLWNQKRLAGLSDLHSRITDYNPEREIICCFCSSAIEKLNVC